MEYSLSGKTNPLYNIFKIPFFSKNTCEDLLKEIEEKKGDTLPYPKGSNRETLFITNSHIHNNEQDIKLRNAYFSSEITIYNTLYHSYFKQALLDTLFPTIELKYKIKKDHISIHEIMISIYEKNNSLVLHRDTNLLSFVILLNPSSQFQGGGTYFQSLCGGNGRKIKLEQGECLLFCGKALHGASEVLEGKRIIVAGFLDVKSSLINQSLLTHPSFQKQIIGSNTDNPEKELSDTLYLDCLWNSTYSDDKFGLLWGQNIDKIEKLFRHRNIIQENAEEHKKLTLLGKMPFIHTLSEQFPVENQIVHKFFENNRKYYQLHSTRKTLYLSLIYKGDQDLVLQVPEMPKKEKLALQVQDTPLILYIMQFIDTVLRDIKDKYPDHIFHPSITSFFIEIEKHYRGVSDQSLNERTGRIKNEFSNVGINGMSWFCTLPLDDDVPDKNFPYLETVVPQTKNKALYFPYSWIFSNFDNIPYRDCLKLNLIIWNNL